MRTPTSDRSALLRLRRPAFAASLALLAAFAFSAPATADEAAFPATDPAPELEFQPASPDNDLAPRWTFSGPEGGTFECSLARDETVVGDWTPCVSPAVYDLTAQPDGTYTFSVRALGTDGALSAAATSAYELNTSVPPQPTIVSLPGPAGASLSPEWTFTGGVGEQFECRVDRGGKTIAPWSACTSPYSVDLTGDPDGSYVFSVRGTGEGGVRGPARTDAYELDTRAPAAPTVSDAPAPLGNDRAPAAAFGAEPGARVECRITGSGESEWGPCTSPHDFELGDRPDGSYALALRATDEAGNTGPVTELPYTLDTTAPDPPATHDPSVSPATRLQPVFRFGDDARLAHECRLDGPGGYATGWEPCTSPAPYDLTGQPDGAYAFAVRATDAAGNTGEPANAAYELTRDPSVVDLRSSPGRIGRSRQPRWAFQVTPGRRFVCSLERDSALIFGPGTCGSPRSYNLSGSPDGIYTFTVHAVADGGEPQQPVTQSYELDSTAPARPDVVATPVSPADDRSPAWRFAGDQGAALDCRVTRAGATVVDWTTCTNAQRFDLGAAPDGDYRVTARARDAAGNLGTPATSDYRLDSTPPVAPSLTAAPQPEDIDRSPTWRFAGESGAVFECSLSREADVIAPKTPCDGTATFNLSGAQPGTYSFKVEATDAAGNRSRARVARYVLAAAPTLRTTPGGGGAPGDSATGGGPAAPGTQPPGTATPPPPGDDAPPRALDGRPTGRTPAGRGGGLLARTPPEAAGPASRPAAGREPASRRGTGQDTASPRPTAGGDDDEGGVTDAVADALGGAARETADVLSGDVARKVVPMAMLLVLIGFLLVQGRIDRREPKLALAPIDAEPDLEFSPPPTRR